MADLPTYSVGLKDKEPKMEVLEQIMKSEASIACSSEVIGMCEKYHEALGDLTSICHTDPNFTHILCGTGFNSLPLLLHLRETGYGNILHLAQPQPIQKILYVHRHSVILQDTQTQWMKKCPLLYYLSGLDCSRADHTKIFLSARTHGHMMRGTFGIPFSEESTTVGEDEHGNMKFFLSGSSFQKNFDKQTPNFLCSYKPSLGWIDKANVSRPTDSFHESPQESDSMVDGRTTDMYAPKRVPAIVHPGWPTKAFGFLTRQRPSGWPSHTLLQKVSANGCHLIPAPGCLVDDSCDEWQLVFDAAEKQLFESLDTIDKQAAFMFHGLICDRRSLNRGVIMVEHIKTTILFALEHHALNADDTHPILTRFMQICQEFLGILAKGVCPHYFIPGQNLFDDIPMQTLEDIQDMIDGLLDQPWIFVLHCHLFPYAFYENQTQLEAAFFSDKSQKIDASKELVAFKSWCNKMQHVLLKQIQESLLTAFHDTVTLYVLTACARLNSFSINECIIYHRDILRMVQDESVQNKLYVPYVDIACTNLASLYHVKALSVAGKRECEYFLIKAEAMFRQSKEMDLCLGRSRLANLLYSNNCFPEAVTELGELLAILDANFTRTVTSDDENDNEEAEETSAMGVNSQQFSEMLWEKWLKKGYSFDIMYNRTLRPLCPAVMKHSVSLAMCNTLGVKSHSVAVFSPIFHTRFLLALCHAGMRDNDQALPILLGLESVLHDQDLVKTLETSEYSEVNEKRIAAYYIVLGNSYLAINEPEKAKYVFREAMKAFPTPRNPANILYMGVRYGDTINGIQQGAKALVVASALAVAYNYVSSQV